MSKISLLQDNATKENPAKRWFRPLRPTPYVTNSFPNMWKPQQSISLGRKLKQIFLFIFCLQTKSFSLR